MKKVLILIVFAFVIESVFSQNSFVTSSQYAVYFGGSNIERAKNNRNDTFDFLDYLSNNSMLWDYTYLGLSANVNFMNKVTVDVKSSIGDNLMPRAFDFSMQYLLTDQRAINVGCFAYSQYIEKYASNYITSNLKLVGVDSEGRYLQYDIYDMAIFVGYVMATTEEKYSVQFKSNIGLSTFKPFDMSFSQKAMLSNFRQRFEYETVPNLDLFVFQELTLAIDLFSVGSKTIGMQSQVDWYLAWKGINYNKSTYKWTKENLTSQTVRGMSTLYSKFGIDIGLYIRYGSTQNKI